VTPVRATGNIGGMDLVELSRRLENLIRFGTIHSVDHAKRRARVQTGHLVTDWLAWIERRAGETTSWDPPTLGEQCVVFSPSGEPGNGLIFYGVPSDEIDTPSHAPEKHVIKFPDGAVFEYDHAISHLHLSGTESILIDNGEREVTINSNSNINLASNAQINIIGAWHVAILSSGGTDTQIAVSGNSEIRSDGFIQLVADGAILIKSDIGVRLQGPTGSLEI